MSKPVLRRKSLTVKLADYASSSLATLLMGVAISHLPFLGWGPLQKGLTLLLEKMLDKLIEGSIVQLNAVVIDFKSERDASRMLQVLSKAHKAKQVGLAPEDMKVINNEIRDKMRDLIRYGRAPL